MKSPETLILVLGTALALILSAVAILSLRRWAAGPRYPLLGSIRRFLTLLALTGCLLIGISILLALPVLIGPLGIVTWVVLIFVVFEGLWKYREGRQYSLLWLLTVSAERNMPLVPAIEAFATERGWLFGRRVRRLAEMLKAGVPLPESLDRCPGLLPPSALPMIRVGCDVGALASALRQATTIFGPHDPAWASAFAKLAYVLAMPIFMVLILIFLMLKIVPQFRKIFEDFGIALPALTHALIAASDVFVSYWFLFAPLYLLALAILVNIIARYFGWSERDLPGIARLTRRLDSAQILDSLALVASQQRPLPEGIAVLARSYPKENIRRRLRLAVADIQAGRDWCESLLRQGLVRRGEAALLNAAQRVGNLPWALREMADSARRRLAYRVQAIVQLLFPPMVICIGLAVMFIVVALFLPLVELIQKMA